MEAPDPGKPGWLAGLLAVDVCQQLHALSITSGGTLAVCCRWFRQSMQQMVTLDPGKPGWRHSKPYARIIEGHAVIISPLGRQSMLQTATLDPGKPTFLDVDACPQLHVARSLTP